MTKTRPPFKAGHKVKWRSDIEATCFLMMRNKAMAEEKLLAMRRGTFTVLAVRPRKWDVKCVCAAKFCGGPPEHGFNCDVHYYPYEGYEIVVRFNGKRYTFPANLFEIVK